MKPRIDRIEGHSFIANGLDADSVVIDLGMCRGSFASEIARRFGCRIVGAEPHPRLFRALQSVARLSARQVALTGRDGTTWLYAGGPGDPTVSQGLAETSATRIRVPETTLDSFLGEANLDHVDLLKIDIEGAEIPMLMNTGHETLRGIEQMTVEFHDFLDPRQRPAIRDVDRRVRSAGFRRLKFSRDNTDVLYLNTRGRYGGLNVLPPLLWAKYRMGVGRQIRRRIRARCRG